MQCWKARLDHMSNVRGMLARVAKLEAARAAPRSPIEVAYGSFRAFEDQTLSLIEEGQLDGQDVPVVLECLGRWHRDHLWSGWRYRGDGSPEYGR